MNYQEHHHENPGNWGSSRLSSVVCAHELPMGTPQFLLNTWVCCLGPRGTFKFTA